MKIEEILGINQSSGSLKLTPGQKQAIREAVKARHHRTGEHWQSIYEQLHRHFKVYSYHEIATQNFQAALNFLAQLPAPKKINSPQIGVWVDEQTLELLGYSILHGMKLAKTIQPLSEGIAKLGLDPHGSLYSLSHETQTTFQQAWAFIQTQRRSYWRLPNENPPICLN